MNYNDQPLIFTRAIGLSGHPRIDVTFAGHIARDLARDAMTHLRANPRYVARIAAACAPAATNADREAGTAALMDILLQLTIELDAIEAENTALELRDMTGPASEHELANLEEAS